MSAFWSQNSFWQNVIHQKLDSVENIIKVTNKKISYLSFAFHNQKKFLLVGSYDGSIHLVPAKIYVSLNKNKSHVLAGHETAPLSIKVRLFFGDLSIYFKIEIRFGLEVSK